MRLGDLRQSCDCICYNLKTNHTEIVRNLNKQIELRFGTNFKKRSEKSADFNYQLHTESIPWDWSQRWDLLRCPGSLDPPPAGHWYRGALLHTQQLSSSHKGLHPSDIFSGVHTDTLWSCPRECSPSYEQQALGWEGWGLHSPERWIHRRCEIKHSLKHS